MLAMSDKQFGAFDQAADRRFEDEMLAHCRFAAPRLAEIRGEDTIRAVIRLGMKRARAHGLTTRGPVRYHIDLMLAFGCDFDSDPQYPWVAASLADTEGMAEMARAEQLHALVSAHAAEVLGPDNAYAIEALRAFRELPLGDHLGPGRDQRSGLIGALRLVYPRKADRVGEAGLDALFEAGTVQAEHHGLPQEPGAGVLTALMFGFGHGITRDPLYPWVAAALADTARPPVERLQRLHRKTLTYVDAIVKHLA